MLSASQKIGLSCAIASLIAIGANLVPIIAHQGPTIHFTKPEAALTVIVVGLLFFGFNALLLLAAYAITSKAWRSPLPFYVLLSGLIVLCLALWGGSFRALVWGDPNAWAFVTCALSALISFTALRFLPASIQR